MITALQARWLAGTPLGYAAAALLVGSMMLGGATRPGYLADTLLQLAAVPLLLLSISRFLDLPRDERSPSVMVLCMAVVALPLVQLVPLPPEIWTALPRRSEIAEPMQSLAGGLPWMPVSLSPSATWLSGLSLLPALAVFMSASLLGYRDRRLLSLAVLAVGISSVFLGLTQVAQGSGSPVRFFSTTNTIEAVGFFANRNHFSALLYTLLIFAGAWSIDRAVSVTSAGSRERLSTSTAIALLIGFTVIVALVAGQVMARSRAGLGLTIVALLAVCVLAISDRRSRFAMTPVKLLLGAAAVGGLLMVQFSLYRVLERFTLDPLSDARLTFARNTIEAAWLFMPVGSGLGTFVPVYAGFEQPHEALPNIYANHAHNDYLEFWMEAGLPGLLVFAIVCCWLAVRMTSVWRKRAPGPASVDTLLARAASVAIALLAVHSVVDYPLRTTAMMAVMAFCCALLVRPPASADGPAPGPEALSRRRSPHRAMKNWSDAKPWPASPADDTKEPAKPLVAETPGTPWGSGTDWPEEWRTRSSRPGAPGQSPRDKKGPDRPT